MNEKKIFEYGLKYHHYANTAYPLTPHSFKHYRIKDQSEIKDFLESEWNKTNELSLYVHIPFCKTRCKFCEYVVLDKPEATTEDLYVSLLLKEIEMYKEIIKNKRIIGYDLGGGTPTKLSVENLRKITNALKSSFNFQKDVIFSIETTPVIAAKEPEKIDAIYKMGYKRISMGIQTVSQKLLNELGREGTTHIYEKARDNIRKSGFKSFNVDLMYGFLHQNDDDFENTLLYAINLAPDHITLYRNRYKGTKIEKEAGGVSLYQIIRQYRLAYDLLIKNGYMANVGKNTFSKIKDDYGTSDYLTKRVIEGIPYLGLGLGAQSFGIDYLAYNDGAANKKLNKYKEKIEKNMFPIQDIYSLSKAESIAKMVSVAFYFGFIDLDAFKKRFDIDFIEYFKDEVTFVLENKLMEIKEKRIYLTSRGSDYINGVIPLFYSDDAKKELIKLYNKAKIYSTGEKEFLEAYNIEDFERPSLTTDVVLFVKNDDNKGGIENYSVVLIKRGEHPYMNKWALPGGFVKPGESVEIAALRELSEEAGVKEVLLKQLKVFSNPERDPRGWIISTAFIGLTDKENISLQFGEDAVDSKLFNLNLQKFDITTEELKKKNIKKERNKIKIYNSDITLYTLVDKLTTTTLLGDKTEFRIIESENLAFDHAEILLTAIEELFKNFSN